MVRGKEQITVVGSGNFGSAIARHIARNVANKERYDPLVRMWVYEEKVSRHLHDLFHFLCYGSSKQAANIYRHFSGG